jgi:hypothetical protein
MLNLCNKIIVSYIVSLIKKIKDLMMHESNNFYKTLNTV